MEFVNAPTDALKVSGVPNPSHDAQTAQLPGIIAAFLDDSQSITVTLLTPQAFPFKPEEAALLDLTSGVRIAIKEVVPRGQSDGAQSDQVLVNLETAPDVSHRLQLTLRGLNADVTPRLVLNLPQFYYAGTDLGCQYTPEVSTFRVWSPTASDVQVQLFHESTGNFSRGEAMERGEGGTWTVRIAEDLKSLFYLYKVTICGKTQMAVDPYAHAVAPNGTRAMIFDPHEADPENWGQEQWRRPQRYTDAVLYEVHVRDFTIDQNSGVEQRGRFTGFTERGSKGPEGVATGLDHLRELGVTHVQLLPIYSFASIDENRQDQYNWGYDPRNYNVPEGAYASTPQGITRIKELKMLVQALHHEGICVNMDVVYNHTFATHDSDFNTLVPGYYYRTDNNGRYTNGSGCGNEIAAERPMVQKFILDSLRYWVEEYHIDGFRFDLMALLGIDTMKRIAEELHTIDPGIMVYGEPWAGGSSALPWEQMLNKGSQRGLGVAVFNDRLRNALDGSVFDRYAKGFATGAWGLADIIKSSVRGSIDDFAAAPTETINYVTSHDNMTLWDKINASNGQDNPADRINMDLLAQAVVLTSQGVPFLQGGEEILRTKHGNDNSYNAGDSINQFDWSLKASSHLVCDYYAGMVHLRGAHPAFRMAEAEQVHQHLRFLGSPENTVAFQLVEHANGDPWKAITVIYNPNYQEVECGLPEGDWKIVVRGTQAGEKVLDQASGSVHVPRISTMILYQA